MRYIALFTITIVYLGIANAHAEEIVTLRCDFPDSSEGHFTVEFHADQQGISVVFFSRLDAGKISNFSGYWDNKKTARRPASYYRIDSDEIAWGNCSTNGDGPSEYSINLRTRVAKMVQTDNGRPLISSGPCVPIHSVFNPMRSYGFEGKCRDPWVTQAIGEVTGRTPFGDGEEGECRYTLYGGGHWSDYPDLLRKVKQAFGSN